MEATEYEQRLLHQCSRTHERPGTPKTKNETNNICHQRWRVVTIDNRIDPKLQRCKCGYTFTPTFLMKLLMLWRGSYTYRCPRCQASMRLVLVHHVVKTEQKTVDKMEIWKHG